MYEITAQPGFSLLATMNPGGDHGKREVRAPTVTFTRALALFSVHPLLTLSVSLFLAIARLAKPVCGGLVLGSGFRRGLQKDYQTQLAFAAERRRWVPVRHGSPLAFELGVWCC